MFQQVHSISLLLSHPCRRPCQPSLWWDCVPQPGGAWLLHERRYLCRKWVVSTGGPGVWGAGEGGSWVEAAAAHCHTLVPAPKWWGWCMCVSKYALRTWKQQSALEEPGIKQKSVAPFRELIWACVCVWGGGALGRSTVCKRACYGCVCPHAGSCTVWFVTAEEYNSGSGVLGWLHEW